MTCIIILYRIYCYLQQKKAATLPPKNAFNETQLNTVAIYPKKTDNKTHVNTTAFYPKKAANEPLLNPL